MPEDTAKTIKHPGRWDVAYADELIGAEMSYEIVRDLLRGPLKQLTKDRKRFPADLELSSILRHDTRVRTFKEGEIIIREGEYGNSAFFILDGGVNIVLSQLPSVSQKNSIAQHFPKLVNSVARAFRRPFPYPENRMKRQRKESDQKHRQVIHLQDFPEFLVHGSESEFDPDAVKTLSAGSKTQVGEIFGEIAAFSRSPRTATVLAVSDNTKLLEIRWQGLRDIRKFSPSWKEMIDSRYRSSSLGTHLSNTEYFKNLSTKADSPNEVSEIRRVADQTQFRSFGEYSWTATFKEMAEDHRRLGESEPVILSQGSIAGNLVVVRNGFVRVSRRYNHGEKTVTYLSKGQTYGMLELFHNSRLSSDEFAANHLTYQHTLSAVGYVDLLIIPAPVVESALIPKLTRADIQSLDEQLEQLNTDDNFEAKRDGKMMEFLLHHRAINGTASMFIDLDRCTHCDDCVRACAATHDNNPRFIRQGPAQDGIQLTHACMHCVDPVCMIGCPTGAIQRNAMGNQVVINEDTCIGCSTCADNCPYDNIQMVELRDSGGDFLPGTRVDNEVGVTRKFPTQEPLQKATKCDLCETLVTGPACVNACPHDALIRLDMTKPKGLFNWIDRK